MKITKTGTAMAVVLALSVVPAAMAVQGGGKGSQKHGGQKHQQKHEMKHDGDERQRGDRGAMLDEHFNRLDTNRDGTITRTEWTRDAQMFDRLDTNRDGALTRTEIQQAMQNRGQRDGDRQSRRFNGLDTNGDGVITRGEWRGNDQSFQQHDANRDGVLSGSEIQRGRGRRK